MKAGLEPDKDVTIVSLGGGAPQIAALEQGRVDAIMTYVPFVQVLEQQKKAVSIFDYTAIPAQAPAPVDQPYMIAVASAKLLEEHPDIAGRVQAALKDVGDWMMSPANAQGLKQELAEGFGESVAPDSIDGIVAQLKRSGVRTEYTCADFANGIDLMKSLN